MPTAVKHTLRYGIRCAQPTQDVFCVSPVYLKRTCRLAQYPCQFSCTFTNWDLRQADNVLKSSDSLSEKININCCEN
jgi:hypothetical protein